MMGASDLQLGNQNGPFPRPGKPVLFRMIYLYYGSAWSAQSGIRVLLRQALYTYILKKTVPASYNFTSELMMRDTQVEIIRHWGETK